MQIVGLACRPPNSPPSLLTKFFMPNVTLSMFKFKDLIVLGDLNYDMLRESKHETRVLIEVCSHLNLHQIVTISLHGVTDNTQTLIDVIITSNRNLISSTDVLLSSISDHSL